MEKLWNLSKTAIPMEKLDLDLWSFHFSGKNACFLKKKEGKIRRDFEIYVVSMFIASVISLH